MRIKAYFVLNFIFFLGFVNSQAQNHILVPPLNTGIYGDVLSREIEAKENGAIIRFRHSDFGTALWNNDSMINRLVQSFHLDQSSSDFDIIKAAASFIKREDVFQHIEAYGSINLAPSCSSNAYTSLPNLPSALCSDFSVFFCQLIKILNKRFATSIRTRIVSLKGHVVNEAFDRSSRKWIYVDADPQTGLINIESENELFSIRDIKTNPQLILNNMEVESEGLPSYDSLRLHEKAQELFAIIGSTKRPVYSKYTSSLENFDFYYQLVPKQKLTWTYKVEGVFVNKNACGNALNNLFLKGSNGSKREFRLAINAYALCQNIQPAMFVHSFKNKALIFSDSTFYGKKALRLNSFCTSFENKSDALKIYIPHLIKSVEQGALLVHTEILKDSFQLNLYPQLVGEGGAMVYCDNFYTLNSGFDVQEDLTEICFHSNDQLNFEVNKAFQIDVIQGGVEVDHLANSSLIWSTRKTN